MNARRLSNFMPTRNEIGRARCCGRQAEFFCKLADRTEGKKREHALWNAARYSAIAFELSQSVTLATLDGQRDKA